MPRTLTHAASPQARGRAGEAGETLIETLGTIALMGFVIVFILGALFTVISVAHWHRNVSTDETVVRSVAESLKEGVGTLAYTPCATTATYKPLTALPGSALPTGYTLSIVSVQYWNGAAIDPGNDPVFSSGPCTPPTDHGLQLITVKVTSPSGNHQAARTIGVYKRNAVCPWVPDASSTTTTIAGVQC